MRSLFPLALFLALIVESLGSDLRVGAAQVVITPPEGTPLAGYYSKRTSDGVLDDLYAKAVVIESAGATCALVALDLITIPRKLTLDARAAIEKKTGIPGTHVMLSATHQHTGPTLPRDAARDELDGGGSPESHAYAAQLTELVAQAVSDAHARIQPARALATKTQVENLAFNRRFWMTDGTVGWNPPKLSPNIVAPAGPHDPEVGIMLFETLAKRPEPLACYVNYAMHPDTTGGTQISADFPAWMAKSLASFKGPGMVTLFANGCCGNLNHRNVWWSDPQHGPKESARLGTILAGAVSAAWPQLQTLDAAPIRARSEIVKLPLPEITDADRTEAREELRRLREPGKPASFLTQVKTFRVLDVTSRDGQPWEVEVQVIALGDEIATVSLPGEIFVELGLAIKAASPFRHTFIAELANGSIGYIPDRKAYAEGNYEVVSARCAEGSGEMLVDAAVRLLRGLKGKTALSQ